MLHNHIPDVHRGWDLADLVGAGCDLRGGSILRPLLWPIHPPTRQIHTNRRGQTSLAKSSSLPGVSIFFPIPSGVNLSILSDIFSTIFRHFEANTCRNFELEEDFS